MPLGGMRPSVRAAATLSHCAKLSPTAPLASNWSRRMPPIAAPLPWQVKQYFWKVGAGLETESSAPRSAPVTIAPASAHAQIAPRVPRPLISYGYFTPVKPAAGDATSPFARSLVVVILSGRLFLIEKAGLGLGRHVVDTQAEAQGCVRPSVRPRASLRCRRLLRQPALFHHP